MKTGLIMEGGAMRGMFTAGVIDVLMEAGVSFDGAIGVSAGAVFGCNYKSRQIGRVIRYNKAYCQDPRYVSFRSLLKTGDIYGEQFCYHELPDRLDPFDVKTYAQNPMNFYVVCTDADTGKAVYHNCLKGDAEDIQWMRASASMPALSRFVKLDSYSLSDGGTADSIPVRFFESIGYDRNVVILTQPEGYVKKPNQLLPHPPDPSLEKSGSHPCPREPPRALQRDPRLHQRTGTLWKPPGHPPRSSSQHWRRRTPP